MKKIISTIGLTAITSGILLSLFLSFNLENITAHAEDSLSDATFDVQKNLTLDTNEQPKKYFDDEENTPIVSFILSVIDFATIIVGSIAMILLIVAGFMFMFAQGEQQQVDEAKDIVKYAVIGLILIFLSYLITIFVQSIFIAD